MTAWLCLGGNALPTPHGRVPVERLGPGDTLLGPNGDSLRLGWIGRLHLPPDALAARPELWPIHVAPGPLGYAAPATLLPGHPIAVPGFPPVAARWLVNGTTIACPRPGSALEIYTLALDGTAPHPCLEDGAAEPPRPDDTTLFALRRHLGTRTPAPLAGSLDDIARHRLAGWVAEPDQPGPVAIELVVNGVARPPILADRHRPDLEAAGIGDGRRGFAIPLDPPLDPRRHHLLRLRRAQDGADLPGSPTLLEAAAGLAPLLQHLQDTAPLHEAARALAARMEG